MEEVISKEELEQLKKNKGETRQMSFKTTAQFVLKEKGEEGLKKLEDVMAEAGYPIKYKSVKAMDFYPLWADAIKLLALQKLFGWDDKKFEEMGRFEARNSLIVRVFLQYIISIEKAVKEGPKLWNKYFTKGNLKVIKLDLQNKSAVFRLENFYHHPLSCKTHKGYFPSLFQLIVKSKVRFEETKCIHRGDDYHEFIVKW